MRCVHSRYRINMEVEEPIANFMELLAIFRNINYAYIYFNIFRYAARIASYQH